jgi:hypothetical protein
MLIRFRSVGWERLALARETGSVRWPGVSWGSERSTFVQARILGSSGVELRDRISAARVWWLPCRDGL